MIISSRQNTKIKRIASLKEKKYRQELGLFVVEGVKMVSEAIAAGMDIVSVAGVQSALSRIPPCEAEIIETDDKVFEYLTDTKTPQGVLAVIRLPENKKEKPVSSCAVLDGVSDPGNLGTIIRTCAALGIKDVYLCGCADAFSPKTIRSSMSGIYSVSVHSFDRETVRDLVSGCELIVADMGGENMFSIDIEKPYALVIGNEANGVSDYFKRESNRVVSVPMSGNIESLNAAVSFAVIAYVFSGKNIK
ncbi:MAG: RNA methyltransferase [Clostridia bacterium]|nr:RNA methyltransferase [Clostridia bacterium]